MLALAAMTCNVAIEPIMTISGKYSGARAAHRRLVLLAVSRDTPMQTSVATPAIAGNQEPLTGV
jgi:hypothetical protein